MVGTEDTTEHDAIDLDLQLNLNGSNTDDSFTVANSNLFLSL